MKGMLIKLFFRSKGSVAALLVLVALIFISLGIGRYFIQKNKEDIKQVSTNKKENTYKNIENHKNDLGLFLYYQKFGVVNQTPNIAGLSIGLRKVNPTIKDVTIRNLEEQKYASELINPLYQMFGNMDFSFILVYFFPLAIIILCFNIASEEIESKRWNMMKIQSYRPLNIIYFKLFFRYLLVISVTILSLLFSKFFLDITLSATFFTFALVAILYISFWFSICCLIISFKLSGSSNLLYLLMIWIVLAIITPATLNGITKSLYPIPESYNTVLKSREGYHEKWDLDKEVSISKFKSEYPQFSKYTHPEGKNFSWLWYYAMQHMGDVAARDDAQKLIEKLRRRNNFISTIGAFISSIHTQLSLNSLTNSDLSNYVDFLISLEQYHKQKRLEYYPKIFTKNTVEKDRLEGNNILAYHAEERRTNYIRMILPFLISTTLIIIYSRKNFKKYYLE